MARQASRAALLRAAHAECSRMRNAGEQPPMWLRLMEAEYQTSRRKPRPRPAGLLAAIRSDEKRRGAATARERTDAAA